MGKIIAIANQKGGVGKTTTTINLGAALALENKKVLIIDLDPQANATIGLGLQREMIHLTSYDVLTKSICLKDAIYQQTMNHLDLIPANIALENIGEQLYAYNEKEKILSHKLENIQNEYDYILLDCPPSVGVLIDNALFASHSVLIPVECEYFAYDALTQMVRKIQQIQNKKKEYGSSLTIEGVLLTKLDNRNVFGYRIVDKVKELFPDKTFKTIISHSSHLQEAPMHGKSVLEFAYNSRGSKQYRELAQELLQNHQKED